MRKLIAACCLTFLTLAPVTAWASPLDDARAAGQVVELETGYIKATSDDPKIAALVRDINQRRHAAYANIAKKNGLTVEQVGIASYLKRYEDERR